MLKYSLRSLMVAVTLVAVALGARVEYLRRWAAFHEREADRYTAILEKQGWKPKAIAGSLNRIDVHNDDVKLMDCHRRLSLEFRKGVSRPWAAVDDSLSNEIFNIHYLIDRKLEAKKQERANWYAPDPPKIRQPPSTVPLPYIPYH